MKLTVAKSPSEALALTNCLILHPDDAKNLGASYTLLSSTYILTVRPSETVLRGTMGMSSPHRNWLQVALGDQLQLDPFDPSTSPVKSYLEVARFEVDILRKTHQTALSFDTDRMAQIFSVNFAKQIFTVGQPLVMDFGGHNLALKVHSLRAIKDPNTTSPRQEVTPQWGIILPSTDIRFSRAPESLIKLVGGQEVNTNAIIQPDFDFEQMGIGGLDKEFWTIFRRAFTSRIHSQEVIQALGIRHVKGLVLYGPPGTGKTLMARQIATILHTREPKIINGPEILNKYVGQSEENIRALFKEAELEYKAKGDNSQLHMIIFDELDAICKQRGGRNDGTSVGDSVVNQLLAKMDGVEQLNNILVIGMTNRLDMLDEALLRPGRFEIQLEIGLPDHDGLMQILKIHTATMRQNNVLAEDVDLEELASMCKNFTGAEIVGLINSATSFALNRHTKVGSTVEVTKDVKSMKVTRDDFIHALTEVHPAYGMDEDEFAACGQEGVAVYSEEIRNLLGQASLIIRKAQSQDNGGGLSGILLYGSAGSGKTAIAAKLATESNFPFVKRLSTNSLVGLSEPAKISAISSLFKDAYKSQLSLIVVDDVEDLIEYVGIGPRFSTSLLQTLNNFFKQPPPKGRRLVIVATTKSKRLMDQLGLSLHFRKTLHVPNVNTVEDFQTLLYRNQSLVETDQAAILDEVRRITARGMTFSVPVKVLQDLFEVAAQDPDNAAFRFADDFQPYLLLQSLGHSGGNIDDFIINLQESQQQS